MRRRRQPTADGPVQAPISDPDDNLKRTFPRPEAGGARAHARCLAVRPASKPTTTLSWEGGRSLSCSTQEHAVVWQEVDARIADVSWPTIGHRIEAGEPVRPEWYSDRFRRISLQAGLPPIKLHSLRHGLAFWLHQEGVTPADAAAWLGHSVEIHLATYLPASSDAGLAFAAQALGRRTHRSGLAAAAVLGAVRHVTTV